MPETEMPEDEAAEDEAAPEGEAEGLEAPTSDDVGEQTHTHHGDKAAEAQPEDEAEK